MAHYLKIKTLSEQISRKSSFLKLNPEKNYVIKYTTRTSRIYNFFAHTKKKQKRKDINDRSTDNISSFSFKGLTYFRSNMCSPIIILL